MAKINNSAEIDKYLENIEEFAKPILVHLRSLIHSTCPKVSEAIKWGIPHFDYSNEMMCIFAAHKQHCSFSFWKSSLMDDVRLKENSELPAIKRFMGKLTSVSDLPPDQEIVAWIKEAMSSTNRE